MPKTTREIIWYNLENVSKEEEQEWLNKKWYSPKEVNKAIDKVFGNDNKLYNVYNKLMKELFGEEE